MRISTVTALGICVLGVAQSAELYTITDLGPGSPVAINNQGTVLGQDSQGWFTYQSGQKQYLPQPAGGSFRPGAINDSGEVVGYTNFSSGAQYYLTSYINGALTVNTAVAGVDPVAINNAGQITGVEVLKYQSFFYSGGTLTSIANQPNVDEPLARAMNSSGVVTGVFSSSSSSPQQAFVFSNGQFTALAVPGVSSKVGGINDLSTIAGAYGVIPGSTLTAGVFIYDSTGFHNLGPAFGGLSAEDDGVSAINNAGVIVGGGEAAGFSYQPGWVYFPGVGFMNLNDLVSTNSGWLLHGATGINDAGDILTSGTRNGQTDVLVLTPAPEPGTALLFVAGLISLVSFGRSVRPTKGRATGQNL